jgi:3-deoxy-D-manno-octulosonic-acid transferase
VRYSQSSGKDLAGSSVLVIDKMGLLSGLYRYATLAYVGGGFGTGIHNLLEAAVYGLPVIFGPNYHHFQEAHDLLAVEGGYSVKNVKKFQEITDLLRHDQDLYTRSSEAAGRYVQGNSGATEKVIVKIKKQLEKK